MIITIDFLIFINVFLLKLYKNLFLPDYYVCLNVEVDPFNPMNCPKFVLHGQLKSIEKFQLRLNTINQVSR